MRRFVQVSLALVLISSMLLTLFGCGNEASTNSPDAVQTSSSEGTAETRRTLTVGTPASIAIFGPGSQSTERYQCKMVFECLLKYNPDTGGYDPCLAESYEYLDPYTLKFTLRDDVYFSNGDHMTAEDVMYSLQEVWAVGNMASYFDCNNWDESYIEDDYTIVLAYDEEYGPGVSLFCQWYIYSKDWCETATDDSWFSDPVGTGPYTVTDIVSGSHVTFTRKDADDYWGELPECEEITYKYYAETSTMFVDFETGALDAAYGLSSSDAARVLNGTSQLDSIGYTINPVKDCLNLVLPEYSELWSDIRVREAFFLAIDTEAVGTAAYGVLYTAATSTLPASVNYYEYQGEHQADVERAKQLMEEAGYGGETIELRLVTTPGYEALSEALQACVSQVGFHLNIEVYDPSVAVPFMRDGEVDLMLKETPGGAYLNDPCMLYDNYSPTAFIAASRLTDPEWVEAFNMGLYSVDAETRAAGYAACQEYLANEFRILPICERNNMIVWNTDIIEEFKLAVADEPVTDWITFAS